MDKMTPICQKGYSGTRYCQEVLISVIEGIEKCNLKKINGAVISLDIKKAFDSLAHSFLQGVYDFFNIGPRLKKWITLLSTNRKACVILEGGVTTNFFDLERGNAQGDTISPFLFNLGYQILLFKLELSLQIEGTLKESAGAVNAGVYAATGHTTLVSPDPKVTAMADDCTLLVKRSPENLQKIIEILGQFENISGLGCNLEKTVMMPVGSSEPIPQGILDLGFQIVNEITLLGAVIKNRGKCYEGNAESIRVKVRKQVNFWSRFNLSLPGRISIAKNLDELWKRELFNGACGKLFNVRKNKFEPANNPILYHIVSCFEKFIFGFTAKNENFKKAFIFENPSLTFDVANNNYLKREFFTNEEYSTHKAAILSLTVDNILNPDLSLKNHFEFQEVTGIVITDAKYNRLRGLVLTAIQNFSKTDFNRKRTDTVQNFCMRIKKGSKKYREVLTEKHPDVISANILRFAEISDQVINLENSIRLNGLWASNYLDNSTRTFMYKFHNNLLGTNTRVAHFVRNHQRTCTFCVLAREAEENDETILHLFFECRHIEQALNEFYNWLLRVNNAEVRRSDFFQGFRRECANQNRVLDLVTTIVKKFIWDCKLRYNLPNSRGMKTDFLLSYKNYYCTSAMVRNFTDKSKLFEGHQEIRF